MNRKSEINRKTSETDIRVQVHLDGSGIAKVDTGIAFFDHMLILLAKHSGWDLEVTAQGDLEVDGHHTVEDVGICLGQVVREAIGQAQGIERYASVQVPMDEALCAVAIDISNRPFLYFEAPLQKSKVGSFDVELVEEFFRAFVSHARITVHIDVVRGTNLHHICEACFKGIAVGLRKALALDPKRANQVPSTKGVL